MQSRVRFRSLRVAAESGSHRVTLAGAGFRLYHLGSKSLWLDEGATVTLARMEWPHFVHVWWYGEASFQGAFFLLMRFWLHLGQSEFWVRLPAAHLWNRLHSDDLHCGAETGGHASALASAAILAFSPTHVYYSQEARSYTMTILLVLLTKPERGSHAPGTFFYYNNWDFNALGTIFEQQFHTAIGREFREKIALPTQMEDFRLEDMYYKRAAPDDPAYVKSLHPAYPFRLSARDLARFGYLVLREGNWNGTRIVPSGWIEQSTHIYTENARDGAGYGYLWWINGFGVPVKNFYALGALGKFVIVVPNRDLVVVLLNHTEFPPKGSTMSLAEYNKLPTVPISDMGHLLELLLTAQSPTKPIQ